jgi:predicted Zn-dependent protease
LPVVKEALRDWEAASNGQLRFKVVQNPEMSRLQLLLSDGPLSHPHENVGHTGYTLDPNAREPLTTLQVQLRVNTGSPQDAELDDEQRLLAIRHELGHALGVWGHSSNPADIMFTHPLVNELSVRDTNTVQKMYAIKPLAEAKEQPLSSLSSRWIPERPVERP